VEIMTVTKASLLALGFAGSMALGVWIAPYVTDRADTTTTATVVTADIVPPAAPEPVATSRADREEVATVSRASAIAPTAPDLHARLKPVMASGTNLEKAAAGFSDSEQFATMAHLARNTGVPFVLLKHRVLTEGHSLGEALKLSKPDADVALEVQRARAAARADIWAVG
jgi:hypothetical protein